MRATLIFLFLFTFVVVGCGGPKKATVDPNDPRLKGVINPEDNAGGAAGPDPNAKGEKDPGKKKEGGEKKESGEKKDG